MQKKATKTKTRKHEKSEATESRAMRIAKFRYGHYPPTEEEIQREIEALNRFAGMISTPPEIIYAVALDTDPTRLGLTMEDLEEMRRRFEKDASGNP
jgi:hypothetical protein